MADNVSSSTVRAVERGRRRGGVPSNAGDVEGACRRTRVTSTVRAVEA
ncbi:hypothetical protein [Gordonia sp. OPL2]|nr:hypothetical protein [Gordonia sp. OPL2]